MQRVDRDSDPFESIARRFEQATGLKEIPRERKERGASTVLILKVANPTNRLFEQLERIRDQYATEDSESPLVTIQTSSRDDLLGGPEGKLLLRNLSQTLNVNRYTFREDFFFRYTPSVRGAEEQITASFNHIVYGRRGAGKSMLLLYALNSRNERSLPCAWVDMQTYARRDDDGVIANILEEVIEQLPAQGVPVEKTTELLSTLRQPGVSEQQIRRLTPEIRRLLGTFAASGKDLFIFLDDLHVLHQDIQPKLLDVLYATSRGNEVYLKISAIETLCRPYDRQRGIGLEISHDAQSIPLDHNLVDAEKARKHITTILDKHAEYCGLPSIRKLCASDQVLDRLTWVSAGVPRDALNLFSQAMARADGDGRSTVSVAQVNLAASDSLSVKLKDLRADVPATSEPLEELVGKIKDFCLQGKRKNAFLAEIISGNEMYERIRELVDLRLLHIISEGITPQEAGRKYLGLILDYGFYTGKRAARSVALFNEGSQRITYRDLRKLPRFDYDQV